MFAVAKEHLEDYLLKESPSDGQLLAHLARCQLQDRENAAAADSYRKALRNAPELVAEYYKLAMLLRQIGEGTGDDAWKEADFWMGVKTPEEGDEWDGQSLTDANPESARAHYLAARWLIGFNEYDRALEALTRSLELEPGDRDALELAAWCCAGKQDFDQARDYANEGIKLTASPCIKSWRTSSWA